MSDDALDREISDTELRLKALREKRKELRAHNRSIRDSMRPVPSRRISGWERQVTILDFARSGMSLPDIAAKTGLSVETVKMYLRAAIAHEADDIQSEMTRINSELSFGLSERYLGLRK